MLVTLMVENTIWFTHGELARNECGAEPSVGMLEFGASVTLRSMTPMPEARVPEGRPNVASGRSPWFMGVSPPKSRSYVPNLGRALVPTCGPTG